MQNHIDFSRFSILNEEVLKKTRRLGKYYAYRQINYQKVELSLFYLWKLIPEQDDDILCRISQIFSEVTKEQNAQLIWARLCVAAYYFFHDEPLWQDLVFRKLKERILLPDLVADVQTAKDLIDGYYYFEPGYTLKNDLGTVGKLCYNAGTFLSIQNTTMTTVNISAVLCDILTGLSFIFGNTIRMYSCVSTNRHGIPRIGSKIL